MNTKLISSSYTKEIPVFPATKKDTRVVTKHFTNLALYLPPDEIALLSWLIYQAKPDNTIIYSTFLLWRYKHSIKELNSFYNPVTKSTIKILPNLKTSIQLIRATLKTLIEKGYLLSPGGITLLINPMLSYRVDYLSKKEYEKVSAGYQALCGDDKEGIKDFCSSFVQTINS